jgi:site-specific DNA-methyltransferase (adenine-specific)
MDAHGSVADSSVAMVVTSPPDFARKLYRSLARDIVDILEGLGFLVRGAVVWQKSHTVGGSCAWGTYQRPGLRPGNPVLRNVSERIIVASKGRFDRAVERLAVLTSATDT